jgi:hypothetical protein
MRHNQGNFYDTDHANSASWILWPRPAALPRAGGLFVFQKYIMRDPVTRGDHAAGLPRIMTTLT